MGIRSLTNVTLERLACAIGIPLLGGQVPDRRPERLVFVCTGNICRSAYAERVAKALGFSAISAGVDTTPGLPANPQAIVEARRRGIDLTQHRTRSWLDVELKSGDVVIGAQLAHVLAVGGRSRRAGCPVVLMSRFCRDRFERVRDPYGKDEIVFSQVFDLIERLVSNMRCSWGMEE